MYNLHIRITKCIENNIQYHWVKRNEFITVKINIQSNVFECFDVTFSSKFNV